MAGDGDVYDEVSLGQKPAESSSDDDATQATLIGVGAAAAAVVALVAIAVARRKMGKAEMSPEPNVVENPLYSAGESEEEPEEGGGAEPRERTMTVWTREEQEQEPDLTALSEALASLDDDLTFKGSEEGHYELGSARDGFETDDLSHGFVPSGENDYDVAGEITARQGFFAEDRSHGFQTSLEDEYETGSLAREGFTFGAASSELPMHGSIDRAESEALVRGAGRAGAYLLRNKGADVVLSVYIGSGNVEHHLIAETSTGSFTVDCKPVPGDPSTLALVLDSLAPPCTGHVLVEAVHPAKSTPSYALATEGNADDGYALASADEYIELKRALNSDDDDDDDFDI
jgi:hypothetical protein